jgi:hypothetical protein
MSIVQKYFKFQVCPLKISHVKLLKKKILFFSITVSIILTYIKVYIYLQRAYYILAHMYNIKLTNLIP